MSRRVPLSHHTDDSGLLSIDFLAGFTIFMLAFIIVATMMSGLVVSLQSRTVDYDAVAYRTSVILVEDPGEGGFPPAKSNEWQLNDITKPEQRDYIKRLGLSLDRNVPGLLQSEKINEFFDSSSDSTTCSLSQSFCYPKDYRDKLIFGDYPYSFNISLRNLNDPLSSIQSVGDPIGDTTQNKYGYIKRLVKIKQPGATGATMNLTTTNSTGLPNYSNETTVRMEFSKLYSQLNPFYRIDPLNENIKIGLQNLTIPSTHMTQSPLVLVYPPGGGGSTALPLPLNSPTIIVHDNSGNPNSIFPVAMGNYTGSTGSYLEIEDGFFKRIGLDEFSVVEIKMVFDKNISTGYFPTYTFDYTTASLAPPEEAVLEVRIW